MQAADIKKLKEGGEVGQAGRLPTQRRAGPPPAAADRAPPCAAACRRHRHGGGPHVCHLQGAGGHQGHQRAEGGEAQGVWWVPLRAGCWAPLAAALPPRPACLSLAAHRVIPTGFTTAQQIYEQRNDLVQVSTGCQALNDILGGGLETGSITELYGEYRCGKTQVRPAGWLPMQGQRGAAELVNDSCGCSAVAARQGRHDAASGWRAGASYSWLHCTAGVQPGVPAACCCPNPACAARAPPPPADLPHAMRDVPAACGHGRRRGQGAVHRHRGHLPAAAPGADSREVRWLAGRQALA